MAKTELRTEVEIDAEPARVWGVISDFARYPEWNPFITRIEGELREGARIQVTMSLPEGGEHTLKPTIARAEPDQELRWLGHLLCKGVLDGEHFFRLEPLDSGRTRFVHGENFDGLLLRFMGRTLTLTARGFVYMNQALKRRVETGAVSGRTASARGGRARP
jgi:hypothetical protein